MTPHAEAIKTLEEIRGFEQSWLKLIPDDKTHTKRIAALTLAIDALKSKSDAEVIVEWLEKNKEYGLYVGSENGRNLWLVDTLDEREIAAPTLSELAAKLKEKT